MDDLDNELLMVETLINRAKTAQISYENLGSQRIFDLASQAVAWAVMQPTNNNLLSEFWFGFCENRSNELASTLFIDNIKQKVNSGNLVGLVFMDLSRAFDTINHNQLLAKR